MTYSNQNTDIEAPLPSNASTKKGRRIWILPTITGIAGLVLGALISGGSLIYIESLKQAEEELKAEEAAAADESAAAERATVFSREVARCGVNSEAAAISDGGMTLTLNHRGRDDFVGASTEEVWCVLKGVGAPEAVISHMEQTTSMDGRQTAAWEDIEVSWSYHPDRGLDSIFTISE